MKLLWRLDDGEGEAHWRKLRSRPLAESLLTANGIDGVPSRYIETQRGTISSMGEKDDADLDFDPEEPDDELSPEAFDFLAGNDPGPEASNDAGYPGYIDDLDRDAEEYVEGARQSVGTEPDDSSEEDPKPAAKAAAIVRILDIGNTGQQEIIASLKQFFARRPHSATFRAIHNLARSRNVSWDLLRNSIELRDYWETRRDFWKIRYAGEIIEHRNGRGQLTWGAARDICEVMSDHHPTHMIDEDWMRDWYNLRPGDHGYFDFVSYVQERVRNREGKELTEGFRMRDDDYNA